MGRDGSGERRGGADSSQLAKQIHFKIFRDYIEHEDELINGRLLWIINIQGFLFATFGFSVQKMAGIQNSLTVTRTLSGHGIAALNSLILMLPVMGILISTFSLVGVFAAQRAIAQLSRDWAKAEKEHLPRAGAPAEGPLLPGITGGGDRRAHILGFLGPIVFPPIFILVWSILLASYLLDPHHLMGCHLIG